MIAAVEYNENVAPRGCASQADGEHHGFRAAVAKGHPLSSGEGSEAPGRISRQFSLWSQMEAPRQRIAKCSYNRRMSVTKQLNSEAHRNIDVCIAIDILEAAAEGPPRYDRILGFFQGGSETGGYAPIREHLAARDGSLE
jgi:hypothetical protein